MNFLTWLMLQLLTIAPGGARIWNDGRETAEELRTQLAALNEKAQAIQARADEESRALTEDEDAEIVRISDEFEELYARLERVQRIDAMNQRVSEPGPRRSRPAGGGRATGGDRAGLPPGHHGFMNFGEMAQCVHQAARGGTTPDRRLLVNAPTSVSSEITGPDGGYAVPPDFRREIVELIGGELELLGRTDQMNSSSNTFTVPVDETSPWESTTGVRAFWEKEGGQLDQSKVELGENTTRLHKLTTLVGVTEELLEDAPALDGYLRRKAPQKMNFKISRAIYAGTGVGQPLGILNSPALVSVAKEGSQAADTVLYANIVKMWSRMYARHRPNAVWLINQDVEPQLLQLAFDPAATEKVPAYLPAGGLSQTPFATLMGRPVIAHEVCETLGDLGDVLLCDLRAYMSVMRNGGIRAETSIHLWFDFDLTAFKFVIRIGGQPWLSAPITPRSGSANTLSPFVALAERA